MSLTGVSHLLLALGGSRYGKSVGKCEKYLIWVGKWANLPPLNRARDSPGSVLLSPLRAFCFSGREGLHSVNSIETLQLDI